MGLSVKASISTSDSGSFSTPQVPKEVLQAKQKLSDTSSKVREKMYSLFFIISKGYVSELPHEYAHSLQVCNLVNKTSTSYRLNTQNGLIRPYSTSLTDIAYLALIFQPCISNQEYRTMVEYDTTMNGDSFHIRTHEINRLHLAKFMKLLGILQIEDESGVRKKCTFTEIIGKQFLNEIKNNNGPEAKAEVISEESTTDEIVEVVEDSTSRDENLVTDKKSKWKVIWHIFSKPFIWLFKWTAKRLGRGINGGFEIVVSLVVILVILIVIGLLVPNINQAIVSKFVQLRDLGIGIYQRNIPFN